MLKKNTTKCPDDKTRLSFEVMHGMRVARMNIEDPRVLTLSARCEKCGQYFKVRA